MYSEKTNLIKNDSGSSPLYTEPPKAPSAAPTAPDKGGVSLRRHIGLGHATGIILSSIIGSGIFITPQSVLSLAGSAGAALVVWTLTGVFAFLMAWCYAELATVMPVTGGDYVYQYVIGGPALAYVMAWTQLIVISPASGGAISQAAGLYLATALGRPHDQLLITLIAVLSLLILLILNVRSVWLALVLNTSLCVAKIIALTCIILIGLTLLCLGKTENLQHAFNGTTTNAASFSMAFVIGGFSYMGWDQVTTIPEEMIRPERDLPLATGIGLAVVTTVYVLTNLAYFTALTTAQVMQSEAVAITFVSEVLGPSTSTLISISVALSCLGTLNGGYITTPRVIFAVGRNKQIPVILSMIHINYLTPVPAILFSGIFYVAFAMVPSLNLVLDMSSMAALIKVAVTLACLLVHKWTNPDVKRPVYMPWWLALLTLVLVLGLLILTSYESPVNMTITLLTCALGLPAYGLLYLAEKYQYEPKFMEKITRTFQKLLLVTNGSQDTSEEAVPAQKATTAEKGKSE